MKLRAQGGGSQLTWAFTLLSPCFFSQSLCLCFPTGPYGAAGHGQHYQLVTVSLPTVCGSLAGWTARNLSSHWLPWGHRQILSFEHEKWELTEEFVGLWGSRTFCRPLKQPQSLL